MSEIKKREVESKMPTHRICNKCGILKLLISEFYAQRNGKYGRYATCKACDYAAKKEKMKIPEVRMRMREYDRMRYHSNPEVRKRMSLYGKIYNKRTNNAAQKRYRERLKLNQGKYKVQIQKQVDRNRVRNWIKNRQSGETIYEIKSIMSSATHCLYCGMEFSKECRVRTKTLDHFIPTHSFGEHIPGNIIPCCYKCNCSKGASNPHVWVSENFGDPILCAVYKFLVDQKESCKNKYHTEIGRPIPQWVNQEIIGKI